MSTADASPRTACAAIVMVVLALIGGTLLTWGIVHTHAVSELTQRGDAAPAGVDLKIDPAVALKLVGQGAAIVQMNCAGCHAPDERLSGPSWQAIAEQTRAAIQADPFCGSGLALVAAGVQHPSPGWDGYAAGPAQNYSPEDRVALAAWILKVGSTAPDSAP